MELSRTTAGQARPNRHLTSTSAGSEHAHSHRSAKAFFWDRANFDAGGKNGSANTQRSQLGGCWMDGSRRFSARAFCARSRTNARSGWVRACSVHGMHGHAWPGLASVFIRLHTKRGTRSNSIRTRTRTFAPAPSHHAQRLAAAAAAEKPHASSASPKDVRWVQQPLSGPSFDACSSPHASSIHPFVHS